MNVPIGSVIRRLRTKNGVSPEDLAEHLGITCQVLSKLEKGTSRPDIMLLPKLAEFFGVRIDELFSVGHEDELERIDIMLQRESMTDQNYAYARRILDSILQDNPGDVEAIKRYALVSIAKSETELQAAGKMLEKAMELNPLDEEIYGIYRSVLGGGESRFRSDTDRFIRVCEPYAYKHPRNRILCQHLVEAMISLQYYDRAEELLDLVQFEGETRYLKEVFRGDIALARGNAQSAKDIWNTIPATDWLGQMEAGERFQRLNDYDRAIECYTAAYNAQAAPHKIDMVYSLAFLYKRIGRYKDAEKAWELVIRVLRAEYEAAEDNNAIRLASREISALQKIAG